MSLFGVTARATHGYSKTGADVDEFEDEFEVEAERRMVYCDAEQGVLVMAHIYVAMPDGNELKLCYHHADRHRAKLNSIGAFLYELSA